MSHPREDLTAYVDGALPPSHRDAVALHLRECAPCRTEHDRIVATVALLGRLRSTPAISPGFEQRFYARLAAQKQARRGGLAERLGLGRRSWRWLAPSVAGAVAAAAVVIWAGERRRPDDTFLAQHLDLFDSYEEVASIDAIDAPDDVQVVAHLHELRGKP